MSPKLRRRRRRAGLRARHRGLLRSADDCAGDLECRTRRIQDPEARAAFERLLDASPEIEAAR
ncbi:MAG: hypothetical protein HKP30_01790 [Myxococcales bacterium]|nr:hypothetical protein [Myxococcales bacterium]